MEIYKNANIRMDKLMEMEWNTLLMEIDFKVNIKMGIGMEKV